MSRHPGDPTPRSPAAVLRDKRTYAFESCSYVGHAIRLIVFHRGSETYWETYYAPTADQQPAEWFQVRPVPVQTTDYVRVV